MDVSRDCTVQGLNIRICCTKEDCKNWCIRYLCHCRYTVSELCPHSSKLHYSFLHSYSLQFLAPHHFLSSLSSSSKSWSSSSFLSLSSSSNNDLSFSGFLGSFWRFCCVLYHAKVGAALHSASPRVQQVDHFVEGGWELLSPRPCVSSLRLASHQALHCICTRSYGLWKVLHVGKARWVGH